MTIESTLYIREGDTLKLRDSQEVWQVVRKVGESPIPSPIGGASVYLPSVVGLGPDNRERVFQQVSPKFWLMVNRE